MSEPKPIDRPEARAARREKADREAMFRTLRAQDSHMHPLELLAFFRKWPRSLARDLVYTAIFSLLIATGFIIFGLVFVRIRSTGDLVDLIFSNIVVSLVIGFTWHFFSSVLKPLLSRMNTLPFPGVIATYTTLGFGITQVGFFLVTFLPGFTGVRGWMLSTQWFVTTAVISFTISLLIGLAWRTRVAGLVQEATLARERERLEAAERAAVQANLRALQAQIEPHFLFNTLANVTGLIHPQPELAKRMLEQFIVYLRATLAATREEHTTLGREFELMRNFLAVLQIRMGDRLNVAITLPADCADLRIPPMLLQPLVENAIKHGLEPKVEGGEISLSALRRDGKLDITIADTGMGFSGAHSPGIGLKNVRERVAKLFGEQGRIVIEDNPPAGTRITLSLPI
jgi:sensor histidine kinase YesM